MWLVLIKVISIMDKCESNVVLIIIYHINISNHNKKLCLGITLILNPLELWYRNKSYSQKVSGIISFPLQEESRFTYSFLRYFNYGIINK